MNLIDLINLTFRKIRHLWNMPGTITRHGNVLGVATAQKITRCCLNMLKTAKDTRENDVRLENADYNPRHARA